MGALQQAWQDVGINIKITFQDTATFVPAFYQKHHNDLACIGGTGDYYPDALRPYASWGNMLNAAVSIEVIQSMPWIWIPPGLAVTLTVLAINFVGDALRDAANTRTIRPHRLAPSVAPRLRGAPPRPRQRRPDRLPR